MFLKPSSSVETMPRTLNRLKPLAVDKAKTQGRYADGGGLYLVVKPGPRKSWAFIYRRGAKMTELGLGSLADVTLIAARTEAADLRAVMAASGDPRAYRERKRQAKALEDARAISFETRPLGAITSATGQAGTARPTRGSGCDASKSMPFRRSETSRSGRSTLPPSRVCSSQSGTTSRAVFSACGASQHRVGAGSRPSPRPAGQ